MSQYLGFDCSTQSVTAIVLEVAEGGTRIVFESSAQLDVELPQYGTRHGVLPSADPAIALSSPLLWADALDTMMARAAIYTDILHFDARVLVIDGQGRAGVSVPERPSAPCRAFHMRCRHFPTRDSRSRGASDVLPVGRRLRRGANSPTGPTGVPSLIITR